MSLKATISLSRHVGKRGISTSSSSLSSSFSFSSWPRSGEVSSSSATSIASSRQLPTKSYCAFRTGQQGPRRGRGSASFSSTYQRRNGEAAPPAPAPAPAIAVVAAATAARQSTPMTRNNRLSNGGSGDARIAGSVVVWMRRYGSGPPPPPNEGLHSKSSTAALVVSESSSSTDADADADASSPASTAAVLIYAAPMAGLISRLKMVSITGCVLSVVVLPTLVYLKNGDLPSAKQTALGSVAFIGAMGSTLALHFVFGPYILDIRSVVKGGVVVVDDDALLRDVEGEGTCDSDSAKKSVDAATGGDDVAPSSQQLQKLLLLQVSTRSVFGWKNTYTFDPYMDITPYKGPRPFANFCANGVPFYAHPELLSDTMRQLLLHPKLLLATTSGSSSSGGAAAVGNNAETNNDKKKKEQQQQQQQRVEGIRDDELF